MLLLSLFRWFNVNLLELSVKWCVTNESYVPRNYRLVFFFLQFGFANNWFAKKSKIIHNQCSRKRVSIRKIGVNWPSLLRPVFVCSFAFIVSKYWNAIAYVRCSSYRKHDAYPSVFYLFLLQRKKRRKKYSSNINRGSLSKWNTNRFIFFIPVLTLYSLQ